MMWAAASAPATSDTGTAAARPVDGVTCATPPEHPQDTVRTRKAKQKKTADKAGKRGKGKQGKARKAGS